VILKKSTRYPVGPSQLLRRDSRNEHREIGFICVVSVDRSFPRASTEGCTSGNLPYSPHQGGLIVSDGGEHEDHVWLCDARLLECLLGGLATSYVGIVMSTHADPSIDSHGRTTSYSPGPSWPRKDEPRCPGARS